MLPRLRYHHGHHHHGGHSHSRAGRTRREAPANGQSRDTGEAQAGHNSPVAHELHSHLHGESGREDLQALAEAFIDSFREADDKTSFLRLAGVPDAIDGPDGLARRLVDVTVTEGFQVATASPGFATRELVYLPYPGAMVRPRTTLTLTYVSLTGRSDIDLIDFLASRFAKKAG